MFPRKQRVVNSFFAYDTSHIMLVPSEFVHYFLAVSLDSNLVFLERPRVTAIFLLMLYAGQQEQNSQHGTLQSLSQASL